MEKVNILVIGAGVVGLATAKVLSEHFEDVVIVEKEKSFGRHTSSRNSEVLHSGIYYPQGTLKSELCVKGLEPVYEYCRENNVPHSNCGKLVVATDEEELPSLYKLKENGEKNGVTGLEIIDQAGCNELEPQIKAIKAMFVPSTGIVDTHKLMAKLESDAEENEAFAVYEMEVVSIEKKESTYVVTFENGEVFEANIVVNSAGLYCDKIAGMVGIDVEKEDLEMHWCKGEYYKTTKIKNVNHLVYPLPDPKGIFLGIHLTINLNGEVRFGPNAYYLEDLDYSMDETYKAEFTKAVNKYLEIDEASMQLDDCGIRPKLQAKGEGFRDFYIEEESDKGFPNFINLIGIESPGLTSCLAIAEKVKELIRK
jgi:L-2-hydroxyglutarate oxidase LhgO